MNVHFQELARSYGLSKRAVNATSNDLMPDKHSKSFNKSFVDCRRNPFDTLVKLQCVCAIDIRWLLRETLWTRFIWTRWGIVGYNNKNLSFARWVCYTLVAQLVRSSCLYFNYSIWIIVLVSRMSAVQTRPGVFFLLKFFWYAFDSPFFSHQNKFSFCHGAWLKSLEI